VTRSYACRNCGRTGPLATFTSRPLKPVRRGGHTEVGSAYLCKDKLLCAANTPTEPQCFANGTQAESGV
jgi:hypothetical protein